MKKKDYPLYEVEYFSNFKEMLAQAVEQAGEKVAFKFKENNAVRDVTYNEFVNTVQALGTGLYSLGLRTEHVAIVSENSYKWITVYLTQLCGEGVFVPVDKELPFEEIVHILNTSDSAAVFFSDKTAKQFRENADKLPNVKYFIGLDMPEGESDGKFISYESLITKGVELLSSGDRSYLDAVPQDDKMKMLVFTSGTTGTSKGVMLSHHNLVSSVYYGMQVSTVYDVGLSILPYTHTYEAVCDILVSLHHHSTICINESLRAISGNFKLYQPEYMMAVPLVVESLYKKIWSTVEEQGKDKALRTLIKTSNALRKVGIDKRRTLFAKIHEVFGGRLIKIVSGGAPIRPELAEFFDAIGINLINGYGITECSPLVSANRDYFNDPKSVGVVLPCIKIKIDDPNEDGEGEICVKGDVVMLGYYKNETATKAVFDDEGYFHTGDYGKINDKNQLFITGRKKNLIVLKNGKNVYPEEIEGYLQNIPCVAEVVVFSNKNELGEEVSLCAEVFLDESVVANLSKEERKALLKNEVDKINKTLPFYKRIQNVRIRTTEFAKTTSRKIKRSDIGVSVEE